MITDNFWHNLKQVVDCPEFDNQKYDTQPGPLGGSTDDQQHPKPGVE